VVRVNSIIGSRRVLEARGEMSKDAKSVAQCFSRPRGPVPGADVCLLSRRLVAGRLGENKFRLPHMTSIPRFASEAAAVFHTTNDHVFSAGQHVLSVVKILV
jgi:hypothetical protein